MKFRRGTRQWRPDGVVAERTDKSGHTARLTRENGELFCQCPYACLATYERCEFDDLKDSDV